MPGVGGTVRRRRGVDAECEQQPADRHVPHAAGSPERRDPVVLIRSVQPGERLRRQQTNLRTVESRTYERSMTVACGRHGAGRKTRGFKCSGQRSTAAGRVLVAYCLNIPNAAGLHIDIGISSKSQAESGRWPYIYGRQWKYTLPRFL